MTNKKRLEEIETKYSTLTVSSKKNSTEYTEVDVEDLVFLIQNGFKQAERVEELEIKIERYRKALEEIRDIGILGKVISTGEIILSDEAFLAEKALEGEE